MLREVPDTDAAEYETFVTGYREPQPLPVPEIDLDGEEILDLFPALEAAPDIKDDDVQEYDPFGFSEEQHRRLARELIQRMDQSRLLPLSRMMSFFGSGCYMLHYSGTDELYQRIRSPAPIYVGRADPVSKRPLFGRLVDHRDSIGQTKLGLANFEYRFLVLPHWLVHYTELVLIEFHRPVWNKEMCVGGFGNHENGPRRGRQRVSEWDTLHPGRPNGDAELKRDLSEVRAKVEGYLRSFTPGKLGRPEVLGPSPDFTSLEASS